MYWQVGYLVYLRVGCSMYLRVGCLMYSLVMFDVLTSRMFDELDSDLENITTSRQGVEKGGSVGGGHEYLPLMSTTQFLHPAFQRGISHRGEHFTVQFPPVQKLRRGKKVAMLQTQYRKRNYRISNCVVFLC